MLEPKTFYRELDAALTEIGEQKSDENFFLTILEELHRRFGSTLCFDGCHIYEKRGDAYHWLQSACDKKDSQLTHQFNVESQVAKLVLKHGSYIFDNPGDLEIFQFTTRNGQYPAAIHVYSTENQWIFFFELLRGWQREEITLFINSVRTALNYRMMADKIESEYERAAQIQRSLLPRKAPDMPGYDVFQVSKPAEVVGGDFYEYFQFDKNHLGFSIGDASGHGFPAALLVRDVVIGLRMSLNRDIRLVRTLYKLNQVIQRSTYSTHFISLFIGEIEEDGELFYVNAGHPPPFIIQNKKTISLDASGIALGFLPEIDLKRNHLKLEPGSVFILYTDGIVERSNREDEMFGIGRLQRLVRLHQQESATNITQIIMDAVFRFGGQTSWEDDATLMVIKRNPE